MYNWRGLVVRYAPLIEKGCVNEGNEYGVEKSAAYDSEQGEEEVTEMENLQPKEYGVVNKERDGYIYQVPGSAKCARSRNGKLLNISFGGNHL